MKLSDFDYELDKSKIAQRPMRPRDESKLFYLKRGGHEHLRFHDLPGLLQEGDVLVRNRSKVFPARVNGKKDTGGKVEILFYSEVKKGWECLVKGKNIKEGRVLVVEGETLEVVENLDGGHFILKSDNIEELIATHGEMPTPPYIKKDLEEMSEYQTIYAEEEGSIAAPTAGFHFTQEVLNEIRDKGTDIYDVILHVGPGTFLPVRTDDVEEHDMEREWYRIPEDTAEAVTRANKEGRRVVLVGTTTVRAIESASENGEVKAEEGWADLFIYPGYEFQSGMDLLLTNFHLPKSTLIMLVSAFVGRERILDAYREAVDKDYRFYSFGDAMLIEGV
ncbi:MAG: tRNA preQ1(34) S-adenosylmethionine ribosyltransferase-isomerase QueA [Thermoplasmata archaeon]